MVKSPGKKNVKIIFLLRCCENPGNLNFEKMDTVSYTGKNDGVMRNI